MESMLKISMFFLLLAVLAAVIGFSGALAGAVGALAQVLVAAFGALFIVSLALAAASYVG